MGILDDLLAGAASGQGGGLPTQRPQRGAGSGPNAALLALLPIVLSMLANRGASASSGRDAGPAGGLGDILGQMMGGGQRGGGGGLGDILGQVLGGGGRFGRRAGRPAAAVRECRSRRPGPLVGEPRAEPATFSGRPRARLRRRRARCDRPPGRALRTRNDGWPRPAAARDHRSGDAPRPGARRGPVGGHPAGPDAAPRRVITGPALASRPDARAQPPANTPSGW